MRAAVVVLQFLIAFVLTATVMPVLLATIPATREGRVGQLLAVVVFGVWFALVALIWPKRKPRPRRANEP